MPYVDRDPSRPGTSLMPYAPVSFLLGAVALVEHALLDTGAAVNVLPWRTGVALGFDWNALASDVNLSGNLANAPAKIVALRVQLGALPSPPSLRLLPAANRGVLQGVSRPRRTGVDCAP